MVPRPLICLVKIAQYVAFDGKGRGLDFRIGESYGRGIFSMMGPLFFEACVESVQAARAADSGGADRIELCSRLEAGGVTPAPALMIAAVAAVPIPVHVLIRPREGDFVYSAQEYDQMRRQIDAARDAGASGVALGVLDADERVDVKRTRALIEHALPMQVTFHRAFDETADLGQALEDAIEAGAESLLTSGGAHDVLTGAASISELAQQAGNRIQIIAGGGLRLSNLSEVVRRSGVYSLHGSLTRESHGANGEPDMSLLERSVRDAIRLLRNLHGEQALAVPK
jgi:copper homeostasis protein